MIENVAAIELLLIWANEIWTNEVCFAQEIYDEKNRNH